MNKKKQEGTDVLNIMPWVSVLEELLFEPCETVGSNIVMKGSLTFLHVIFPYTLPHTTILSCMRSRH